MANSDTKDGNDKNDKISRSPESRLDKESHHFQGGLNDSKEIENARTNAHSGSAGVGGEDESIQIEALDSAGNKIIASRFTGMTELDFLNAPESITQSHLDLKIAAKSNSALEPVANLRDYVEKLPATDPNKIVLQNLAKEQYQLLSSPQAYAHNPSDDDAGSFLVSEILQSHSTNEMKVIKKEDGSIQLNIGIEAQPDENKERLIGATIGIVESIGSLSVDVARVADFTAAVLKGDKKTAEEMGAAFGELLGKSIIAGIDIFQQSYNYLYEVGFQSDAAKPFKDIVTLGSLLDSKWSELAPKEQERLKFRLITDIASGLLPIGATSKIKQANTLPEVLAEAGAIAKEVNASEKTVITAVGGLSDDLTAQAMRELEPGERWVGAPIGNWKVYDCIESGRVIKQSEPLSCASACGEMLVDGLRNEEWFKDKIGVPAAPADLAAALRELTGQDWRGGHILGMTLEEIMEQAPWGAVLLNQTPNPQFLHMVVVDGWIEKRSILIRDPAGGLLYKMTEPNFREAWGFSVARLTEK